MLFFHFFFFFFFTKDGWIAWRWGHMQPKLASMSQFQLAALILGSSPIHQSCFTEAQNNNTMRREPPVNNAATATLLPSIYKCQTQTDGPILTQFTPPYNVYFFVFLKHTKIDESLPHTHSSNSCSTLIAQLSNKGHPGVAASRSRPLPSPWWSPASLMSLCLVSAY